MHLSPNPPSRIFIIGYTSAWRLELTGTFREQGFVVSFFEDARLAAYALTYACPGRFTMYYNDLRGSKASRTASPIKINRVSMMARTKKADSPSQGA